MFSFMTRSMRTTMSASFRDFYGGVRYLERTPRMRASNWFLEPRVDLCCVGLHGLREYECAEDLAAVQQVLFLYERIDTTITLTRKRGKYIDTY